MNLNFTRIPVQRMLYGAIGAVVGGWLAIAPYSHAVLVDPTVYPDGTDISALTPGVTLSAPGNPNSTGVFSVGSSYLGYSEGGGIFGTLWSPAFPMRADFTAPITSVSLYFVLDGGSGGSARLEAFDAGDNLIDSQTELGPFSDYITSSVPGISYILASFPDLGAGHDLIAITELQFAPLAGPPVIPEPGSVLAGALILGLGGAGIVARRRWKGGY